jgi:hypothetical protein
MPKLFHKTHFSKIIERQPCAKREPITHGARAARRTLDLFNEAPKLSAIVKHQRNALRGIEQSGNPHFSRWILDCWKAASSEARHRIV